MTHAACCPDLFYPYPGAMRSDAVIMTVDPASFAELEAVAVARTTAAHGIADRGGVGAEHEKVRRVLLGALGEWAFARWARMPFDPKPFGIDVGEVNVRTRARLEYELIIQRRDLRDHPATPYVLVSATRTWRALILRGWLTPTEAERHPEWLKDHGGYSESWFPPTSELHDLRRLRP